MLGFFLVTIVAGSVKSHCGVLCLGLVFVGFKQALRLGSVT